MRYLLYAAAWLPYWTASAAGMLAAGTVSTGVALRMATANTLPEAGLGLLVLTLPRRLPWPEGLRPAFLAGHATAATAFAAVVVALKTALFTLDRFLAGGALTWTRPDLRLLPWQLFVALLVYATLCGLAYARANALRVREQAERAARAETLRAQAELAALRAQLNPHFLFNTLHAVMAVAGREPAAAQAALEQLGDLLRYALRVHRDRLDQVSLGEEWEFVRAYLDLEKLRLGERLHVTLAADADALSSVVPPFCLQPLVENAVQHAVAPRAAGGRVEVSARRSSQELVLVVSDDGPGSRPHAAPAEGGLGLRLVQDRLCALYGTRAGFQAGRAAGGGFHVELRLPAGGVGEAE